jgi:hypothetical protein
VAGALNAPHEECITVVLTSMHHRSTFKSMHHGDAYGGKMSRVDPQFKLRLPQELKNYLSEQAELNRRSQTAEVIYRLEQSRKQDESQRGKQADA